MKSWDIKIFWKKPTASVVSVEAESQAAALAMLNENPGQFLTTLNPTTDADRVDVRESKNKKAAATTPTPKPKGDPQAT